MARQTGIGWWRWLGILLGVTCLGVAGWFWVDEWPDSTQEVAFPQIWQSATQEVEKQRREFAYDPKVIDTRKAQARIVLRATAPGEIRPLIEQEIGTLGGEVVALESKLTDERRRAVHLEALVPEVEIGNLVLNLGKVAELEQEQVIRPQTLPARPDVSYRIESLSRYQQQLETLMEATDKVADKKALLREITEVQTEIEALQAEISTDQSLTGLAQVSVTVRPLNEASRGGTQTQLQQNWDRAKGIGLRVLGASPLWGPVVLVLSVLLWLTRRRQRDPHTPDSLHYLLEAHAVLEKLKAKDRPTIKEIDQAPDNAQWEGAIDGQTGWRLVKHSPTSYDTITYPLLKASTPKKPKKKQS